MTITIEDFQKVDIRVGNIVAVEDVPKARKPCYKVTVDFGPLGMKTSGAGVASFYSKEELVGRQVVAVVNFPPRQIANVMSEVYSWGPWKRTAASFSCIPTSRPLPEPVLPEGKEEFWFPSFILTNM